MSAELVKRELRAALRPYHVVLVVAFMATSVAMSWWMPLTPPSVFRFFQKVFWMKNWTEIILVNDYLGVFTVPFWAGVVDLLRVYVVPLEEGYLDLLLSKPLSRTQYLFARLVPRALVLAGMGIALALFLPLKIALVNGGADLHVSGVFWAGIASAALALLCLAILNLVFLFTRETYYAVLLAFALFSLIVLPGGVFMYRPDLFQDHALARDTLVFPGNLVWFTAALPKLGPVLVLAAAGLGAIFVALGGRRLKRIDLA